MLVQSFSPSAKWFDDFEAFAQLFGQKAEVGKLLSVGQHDGIPLYIGWCIGDQAFREPLAPGA